MPSPAEPAASRRAAGPDPTRGMVRGSALLFGGRLLSKVANFVVQVLIVRSLSQESFGGFAYALSIASLAQGLCALGMEKAIARFLPIDHERGDSRRFFGTIVFAFGLVLLLGATTVAVFHSLGTRIGSFLDDPHTFALVSILIFLGPIQALDDLLTGVFAVFARARAIFVRRHLIAPALKIAVVLGLILSRSDAVFLAFGYLLSSLAGLLVYGALLIRTLRNEGLLRAEAIRTIVVPWRELLGFGIPLLTTDLVYLSITAVNVFLLQYYRGGEAVAGFRAVQPVAQLGELVMISFATLYTPVAARLYARRDLAGLDRLYWRTATWIAILSFPILAVTFSLAHPITVLLFGSRYEASAPILAMLSAGYYFNAALGFNGLTLRVFGRIRAIVLLNLATAVVSVIAGFLLIPRLGALGAGIAATLGLVVHNVLKQTALHGGTGIHLFEWRYSRAYLVIAAGAVGLLALQLATAASTPWSLALAAVMALLVIRVNRGVLEMESVFPEAMRIPGARFVLTGRWRGRTASD